MNRPQGRADMHMHTRISDGAADVKDLLAYIQQNRQLDVIAITDHDRLDASLAAYEQQESYPFEVVPGLEVTSREGHVLAWWVTELIPAGMSLEETVQAIHEAGGLAVLAHPFYLHVDETRVGIRRYWRDIELIARAGFDAVEAVNAGTLVPGMNWYTQIVCRELGLAYVGNSDAHTLNAIASGRTAFPGKTAVDVKQAVLSRRTSALGGIWPPAAYFQYAKGSMDGTIQHIDLTENMENSGVDGFRGRFNS